MHLRDSRRFITSLKAEEKEITERIQQKFNEKTCGKNSAQDYTQ
jgi:hypothetical protein